MDFKDKEVLVVGLGKSGIAAADELIKLGAKVSIQDSKTRDKVDNGIAEHFEKRAVRLNLGELPSDMGSFDMLVLSPGVTPELSFVQEAKAKGAEIIGELELAYRIAKGRYIGITGTNGKTTTTTLVGEIFEASGRKTYVGGNIGVAVVSQAAVTNKEDWLVTECSSFQLETTKEFKPFVSAILNITPDHLNRHHTMEAYAEAKAMIFANQDENGYFISNNEDKICMKLAEKCKAKVVPFSSDRELEFGAFVKDEDIVIKLEDGNVVKICKVSDIKIIGKHNVENVLAAAAICYFAGIDEKVIGDAIKAFKGVEHRIEFAGEVNGVKYYNDSKGTNTDAAITALKALGENIILIAGGDAKEQDFTEFAAYLNGRVKTMILLGRDAGYIQKAADAAGFKDYVYCKDMDECVAKAHEIASEGDSVLLSPACASWDMYPNYEVRGRHFKSLVKNL